MQLEDRRDGGQGPGEKGCVKAQMLTAESGDEPLKSLQQEVTVLMKGPLEQQLAEWSGDGVWCGEYGTQRTCTNPWDDSGLNPRHSSAHVAGNKCVHFCDYREVKPRDWTLHSETPAKSLTGKQPYCNCCCYQTETTPESPVSVILSQRHKGGDSGKLGCQR